jgi:hypothetical protein
MPEKAAVETHYNRGLAFFSGLDDGLERLEIPGLAIADTVATASRLDKYFGQ